MRFFYLFGQKIPVSLKELRVIKPCNQDWEDMEGTPEGRFCEICRKEVYDLRNISTKNFQDLFRRKKGNVCGIAYQDELGTGGTKNLIFNRILKRTNWWLTVLFLRFSSILIADGSNGTVQKTSHAAGHHIHIQFKEKEERRTATNARIYGYIKTKKDSIFLSSVTVSLVQINGKVLFSTQTNKAGYYEINLPDTFNLAKTYFIKAEKENTPNFHQIIKYRSLESPLFFSGPEVELNLFMKRNFKQRRKNSRELTMGKMWY